MKKTIVVDIDNTIIDTAVRKLAIIKSEFPDRFGRILLETVRKDYHLDSVFGSGNSSERSRFLQILLSSAGIVDFPAPAFIGAASALRDLAKEYNLLYLTARSEDCRETTIKELQSLSIPVEAASLFMSPFTVQDTNIMDEYARTSKFELLEEIVRLQDVIVMIGDRKEDLKVANEFEIPFILFLSTLNNEEVKELLEKDANGVFVCRDWDSVAESVKGISAGIVEYEVTRQTFTQQYSEWLGQLDVKCGMLTALSAGLITISSTILEELAKQTTSRLWELGIVGLAGFLGVVSAVFGIRGYTSRLTSGQHSGNAVNLSFKQVLPILFNFSSNFKNLQDDAIDEFNNLRKQSPDRQARAHRRFFYNKYHSYNTEIIKNLRLYELRATNYEKVYAERWGSRIAIVSIILIVMWAILAYFGKLLRV